MQNRYKDIVKEVHHFCGKECDNQYSCTEEYCVLFRIEKLAIRGMDNE